MDDEPPVGLCEVALTRFGKFRDTLSPVAGWQVAADSLSPQDCNLQGLERAVTKVTAEICQIAGLTNSDYDFRLLSLADVKLPVADSRFGGGEESQRLFPSTSPRL